MKQPTMNLLPGYVNLLKTAIGSGILTYPFLFATYGIIPATIFTLIAAFFSCLGLILYIIVNDISGIGNSLTSLAQGMFPLSKSIADAAIALKCYGVSVSYLVIARQLLPRVINQLFNCQINPTVSLFIFTIISGSLCFFKNLRQFRFTSFVGIFCITLVVCSTLLRFSELKSKNDYKLATPIFLLWYTGIGKFVFSFTCHQNIFGVHADTRASRKSMIWLAIMTIASAYVLYITFGLLNYLLFTKNTTDNILQAYPLDALGLSVQGLYIIVMCVSYPLQVNPCRFYILELFTTQSQKWYDPVKPPLVTVLILVASFLVAASGVNLGTVYSIIGATVSSFLVLILPPIFYFRFTEKRNRMLGVCATMSMSVGCLVMMSAISIVFVH